MKNRFLVIALLLVSAVALAQTNPEMKLNKETNLIEATYFHDNGMVSQEGTFNLQKELHGKWVSYNEAGEKISVGNYTNGLKSGTWAFYSGEDKKVVEYSNNAIASVDGIKKQAPVVKN